MLTDQAKNKLQKMIMQPDLLGWSLPNLVSLFIAVSIQLIMVIFIHGSLEPTYELLRQRGRSYETVSPDIQQLKSHDKDWVNELLSYKGQQIKIHTSVINKTMLQVCVKYYLTYRAL